MLRLERHRLGPRVHLLGRRVHEWHLGALVLAAALGLLVAGVLRGGPVALGLVALGGWLVAKDWRDLVPARRDTAAWRLGLHRPPQPLRLAPRGGWVPPAAAAVAGVTALANLASTLTPDFADRARVLHVLAPLPVSPLFHALALPASAALGVTAVFLARRRRRAWQLALTLLLALGAIDLLKGLDVEEAGLSWLAAGLLWWGRPAFSVAPGRVAVRAALRFAGALLAGTLVLATVAAWVALHERPDGGVVLREAADLLLWRRPPVPLGDEFRLLGVGMGLASLATLLVGGVALFRPVAASRALPGPEARRAAMHLVRAHGSDTLAFFKLRGDKQYLFSPDGRAFCGYRIVHGVLLVSGDPVGPPDAFGALVRRLLALADRHGLAVGVVGAGAGTLELWRDAGLSTLYLGDEAVIETGSFSLEGRRIRKVRQSVTRLGKAGYTAEALRHEDLDEAALAELEAVSEAWLDGKPERGFSMAMDTLRGEHQAGTLIVAARGPDGQLGGFLHFVPAHGRAAMSLGFMRRLPGTPNGLTEFLVVRALELLRERGVAEVSLNFCAFGRWLREPANRAQRLLVRVVGPLDRVFQVQSLLHFNEKFFPRWDPRHMAFQGWRSLPRTCVAALEAEGQLPRPALPARPARRRAASSGRAA